MTPNFSDSKIAIQDAEIMDEASNKNVSLRRKNSLKSNLHTLQETFNGFSVPLNSTHTIREFIYNMLYSNASFRTEKVETASPCSILNHDKPPTEQLEEQNGEEVSLPSLYPCMEDGHIEQLSPTLFASPGEYSIGLSFADLRSPLPPVSFSPRDKILLMSNLRLRMVITELIETEEFHIASLKMLLYYYLEPLATGLGCESRLIVLMKHLISHFLTNHMRIFKFFTQEFYRFTYMTNELGTNKILCRLSSIIQERVEIFYFIQYCSILDDIICLIKSSDFKQVPGDLLRLNQEWVDGWETFLEATQPKTKKMDLSFISLSQKPISRLSKYLLLMDMMRRAVPESDEMNFVQINETYNLYRAKLEKVNRLATSEKEINPAIVINKLFDFGVTSSEVQLCLQFFGKPLLIGSIVVIWFEKEVPKSYPMVAILYKSHLIFGELSSKKFLKGVIKFIIPLSQCILSQETGNENYAIFTHYPYCSKLLFAAGAQLFEIFLCFLDGTESQTWLDHLDTLINHVNGPLALKSIDPVVRNELITIFPPKLNIHLHNEKEVPDSRSVRSSKMQTLLQIRFTYLKTMTTDNSFSKTCSDTISPPDEKKVTVNVKLAERYTLESHLLDIWSPELPLLYHSISSRQRVPIKKSSSWAHLRLVKGSSRTKGEIGHNDEAHHQEIASKDPDHYHTQPALQMPQDTTMTTSNATTNPTAYRKNCVDDEILFDNNSYADNSTLGLRKSNSVYYKVRSAVSNLFQTSRSNSLRRSNSRNR